MYRCADLYHVLRRIFHKLGTCKTCCRESGRYFSTLGVAMTAALVGAFCHFILKLSLPESFLIGSVVSCTDAASVFSIFRSKNLNLEGNLAPLLEIESGSNDPFSYMLTVIALTVMKRGRTGFYLENGFPTAGSGCWRWRGSGDCRTKDYPKV